MKPAIDRLLKDDEFHEKILQYLLRRLRMSEEAMRNLQNRWTVAEKLYQAYIKMDDYEKYLKQKNDDGQTPKVLSVQIPYAFASISTICTYLLHTFAGRRPVFQVSTYAQQGDYVEAAKQMELVLQYNADHTKYIMELWKWLLSAQIYGFGIFRTAWVDRMRMGQKITPVPNANFWGDQIGQTTMRSRAPIKAYSGNEVYCIDPWMFFPDPRVPMTDVNRKGEFVFWRDFTGKFQLKKEEAQGRLFGVDKIKAQDRTRDHGTDSARSLRSGGAPIAGTEPGNFRNEGFAEDSNTQTVQIDCCTIELFPKELELSDTGGVQKWIFVIANRNRIIMADPFENDHDMHPVAVAEPLAQGYEFGGMSMAEYLKPINDTLTWLINSHIYNVRTALNNMYIVDPAMIEMQDLKNPGPGKHIRLKPAAQGMDVRSAITQLVTQDMTSKHFNDAELFMSLGERISAVNQNLMGLQDPGGRKTATEVRTSGESGASRLASTAMVMSAQGLVDLRTQMCLNAQQYMDQEFYRKVLGDEGLQKLLITSGAGDYYFPTHDGTLPLDRTALAMVWKEILEFSATNPYMQQNYSIPRIFETTAKMAGATDIESYRITPTQIAPQIGAPPMAAAGGNVVPFNALAGAPGGA